MDETTQEQQAWQSFDSDAALLEHILSKKPAEKLVDVPEWGIQVLCKALNAEHRVEIEVAAYNPETKTNSLSKVSHLAALYGSYNPVTGRRIFSDAHKDLLRQEQDGGVVTRLAMTVFRLSRMIASDADNAKKN